jgi:hypothetical protein
MCTVELVSYFVGFSKFLRPQKYPGYFKKCYFCTSFTKKQIFYQKINIHARHSLLKLINLQINAVFDDRLTDFLFIWLLTKPGLLQMPCIIKPNLLLLNLIPFLRKTVTSYWRHVVFPHSRYVACSW